MKGMTAMTGKMAEAALDAAYTYLMHRYGHKNIECLCSDLCMLAGCEKHCFKESALINDCSYEDIQGFM